MAKHYDKQFKLDAVQYYHDHKNLGLQGCATKMCIRDRETPAVNTIIAIVKM